MAAAQSPEAKELALVGKVEMRIALADSEKKLEDLLKVYLAPLLLKLASEHVAVRNKVRPSLLRVLAHLSIFFVCCTPLMRLRYRSSPSANISTLASSHSTRQKSKTLLW